MIGEQWAKSTFSHTNGCVEARWVKATASGLNGCVEVVPDAIRRVVQVRDSKDPDGPTVTFTWWDWAGVLNEVRRGVFDWHRRLYPLKFTPVEQAAFTRGVKDGEFELPVRVEDPDREHAAKLARRLHL
jgi:hypothetical protein